MQLLLCSCWVSFCKNNCTATLPFFLLLFFFFNCCVESSVCEWGDCIWFWYLFWGGNGENGKQSLEIMWWYLRLHTMSLVVLVLKTVITVWVSTWEIKLITLLRKDCFGACLHQCDSRLWLVCLPFSHSCLFVVFATGKPSPLVNSSFAAWLAVSSQSALQGDLDWWTPRFEVRPRLESDAFPMGVSCAGSYETYGSTRSSASPFKNSYQVLKL